MRFQASLFFLAILFPILAAQHSLQKGQAIKQFFAYSITQSIAEHPTALLSTTLPCDGKKPWAEEPPVFHFLAAMIEKVAGPAPAVLPILAFAFLILGIAALVGPRIELIVAAALTPIFLRYSVQHLPDLLATTLLVWGAVCWNRPALRGRTALTLFFFILAATTKFLVIFAAFPILLWDPEVSGKSKKSIQTRFLRASVFCTIAALPFALWLWALHDNQIPNPFFLKNAIENRHSGSLALLISPHYWLRFLTWNAVKGTGIFLFAGACFKLRKKSDSIFYLWAWGTLPYWILVRGGNWTHDYYTLPFALPLAILGAEQLFEWRREHPRLATGALAINAALAVLGLLSLREIPLDAAGAALPFARPTFCQSELTSPPQQD